MATKKKSNKTKRSFLKTGSSANKELDIVKKEQDARKEQMDKPFRFSLHKDGEEARITFLDGALDSDGVLEKVCFHEHHVQIAGMWGNFFVCPGEFEPCPICEEGISKKEFVAVFTVIDHRKHTGKDGKVYKNQRKLFVCKSGTLDQLQKIASKKGGLVGVTLEVTRTGDKKARVGDLMMYDKTQDLKKVAKKLGAEGVLPLDYDECFPSYSAKELSDNFGFTISSVGSEMEVEDDDGDLFDDDEPKKGKKKKVEDDDDFDDDDEDDIDEDDTDEEDEEVEEEKPKKKGKKKKEEEEEEEEEKPKKGKKKKAKKEAVEEEEDDEDDDGDLSDDMGEEEEEEIEF